MTRPHLRPCPGCSRHLRVSDTACIFCGISLGASFRASPLPASPSVRLSRAALVAFGTGTLSLAAACGGAIAGSAGPAADAGRDTGATSVPDSGDEDSGTIIAPYGAPPYGGFPTPDGGFPTPDAGEADSGEADSGNNEPPKDAASDSTGVAPPYGGVPMP
jgi:hypothetical protein